MDVEMIEAQAIEWRHSDGLTDYAEALATMERRAAGIHAGTAPELIWLLEHPPLYTAGTSADPAELFNPDNFPVHQAGRGGRYTYHGPGQRVGYVLLDLNRRGRAALRPRSRGLADRVARSAGDHRLPRLGPDRHLGGP
jgi:lipoyl(octanoyl) transferase